MYLAVIKNLFTLADFRNSTAWDDFFAVTYEPVEDPSEDLAMGRQLFGGQTGLGGGERELADFRNSTAWDDLFAATDEPVEDPSEDLAMGRQLLGGRTGLGGEERERTSASELSSFGCVMAAVTLRRV
jgi:hypothetical protein